MSRDYGILLQAILKRFGSRLKAVVLFGSRARGEARSDSDHDVFIVAEDLPTDPLGRTRMVRGAISDCLADMPGAINLQARTPAEFEADLTPLFLDICVDGICLFGEAYFEPLRRRALAALASSGMKRKHVAGSLFWMFPKAVPHNWELTWNGYHERP